MKADGDKRTHGQPYEPPSVEVLGTLQELTLGSPGQNIDIDTTQGSI